MSHEYDVFLSYNRDDKVEVESLKRLLEGKYHVRAWLDTWNLVAGQPWMEDIEDALDKCTTFAILIGPKGIGGWNNEEMRAAVDIRSRDKSRRVIPVYLPGAPDEKSLPTFLKILTPIDFRNGKGFDDPNLLYQLHRAIKGLERGESLPDDLTDAELQERINTGIPDGSYIRFVQNAYFTGRAEVMAALEQLIFNTKDHPPIILNGMGGAGKTQTAVEFAYRYGYRFRGVHWINLDSSELLGSKLESEIAQCGRSMGIALDKQEEQAAETLRRWKHDGPRLVVLDNFELIDQVQTVFSRLIHSNIRILVTSRRSDWPPELNVNVLPLHVFQPQESVGFLRARLGHEETESDLMRLADKLGYLPLALELASSYIRVAEVTVSHYLKELASTLEHDSMRAEIFDTLEIQTSTEHILDLRATFALSWQKVKDPIHQDVFRMAGYLAPNVPIPVGIFEGALEQKGITIKVALLRLYGLSLLSQTENSEASIHPLFSEYAREQGKERPEILERVAKWLQTISVGLNEVGVPVYLSPFRPHLPVTASYAEAAKLPNSANLWASYGNYLRLIADYSGAQSAFEHALKIYEAQNDVSGSNDLTIAETLADIARVMADQGKLEVACKEFERALHILQEFWGVDHLSMMIVLSDLGEVLLKLGDLERANTTFLRSIKIAERTSKIFGQAGNLDLLVANAEYNLGSILLRQGQNLASAKESLERAMKLYENSLGTEHPKVGDCAYTLGEILRAQRDINNASVFYAQAVKAWVASLGSEHPKIALGLSRIGDLRKEFGDFEAACIAYRRALEIDEAAYGPNHPNVAIDANNLGSVLQKIGDFEGARRAFERALEIDESAFGSSHPRVAGDLSKLARLLQSKGDIKPALSKSGLELRNLGVLVQAQRDLGSARAAYERAIEIWEANLATEHPSLARDLNNLGSVLKDMTDLEGARNAYERALKILKQFMPPNHPNIKTVQRNLDSLK